MFSNKKVPMNKLLTLSKRIDNLFFAKYDDQMKFAWTKEDEKELANLLVNVDRMFYICSGSILKQEKIMFKPMPKMKDVHKHLKEDWKTIQRTTKKKPSVKKCQVCGAYK